MAYDHRKYRPFPPIDRPHRRWPQQVTTQAPMWCSVDLRDGNQALVRPMSIAQKQTMFDLLANIGLQEIEVGFPSASQIDFDFVRQLIEQDRVPAGVTLQVLTQARRDLIERTFESLAGARRAIVHLYNSTSTIQRERVFQADHNAIRELAVQGATWIRDFAHAHPETEWLFQYSPESFTGTELDVAADIVNAVLAVWQDSPCTSAIINLPATVEMSTPNVFADMVEWMSDHIHNRENVILSLHTHNDRGCGVAAAELGLLAGADRLEGTLLGNGERTGNMDLITAAMNLYSQGIDPQLDLSDMQRIIQTVEMCTEIKTHPRHAYAGELVYTAFSGSHQDAIRKCLTQQRDEEPWQVAYLPIDPADLNRRYEEVVRINSQSGKGGVLHVLERDAGITIPRWMQISFSKVVQHHAEQQGGELDGTAIRTLFESTYTAEDLHAVSLQTDGQVSIQAASGTTIEARAMHLDHDMLKHLEEQYNISLRLEALESLTCKQGYTVCLRIVCEDVWLDGVGVSPVALEAHAHAWTAIWQRLDRQRQRLETFGHPSHHSDASPAWAARPPRD